MVSETWELLRGWLLTQLCLLWKEVVYSQSAKMKMSGTETRGGKCLQHCQKQDLVKNWKNSFSVCTIKSFVELQHQSSCWGICFKDGQTKYIVNKYMCVLFTINDYCNCQDSVLTLTPLQADSGAAQWPGVYASHVTSPQPRHWL